MRKTLVATVFEYVEFTCLDARMVRVDTRVLYGCIDGQGHAELLYVDQ